MFLTLRRAILVVQVSKAISGAEVFLEDIFISRAVTGCTEDTNFEFRSFSTSCLPVTCNLIFFWWSHRFCGPNIFCHYPSFFLMDLSFLFEFVTNDDSLLSISPAASPKVILISVWKLCSTRSEVVCACEPLLPCPRSSPPSNERVPSAAINAAVRLCASRKSREPTCHSHIINNITWEHRWTMRTGCEGVRIILFFLFFF